MQFSFLEISFTHFTQQFISNPARAFVFNSFLSQRCMLINNTRLQVLPNVPHFI